MEITQYAWYPTINCNANKPVSKKEEREIKFTIYYIFNSKCTPYYLIFQGSLVVSAIFIIILPKENKIVMKYCK